jgi:hypothetical protein
MSSAHPSFVAVDMFPPTATFYYNNYSRSAPVMLVTMHVVRHIRDRVGYYIIYIFFTNLTSVWSIWYIRKENKRMNLRTQVEGALKIL